MGTNCEATALAHDVRQFRVLVVEDEFLIRFFLSDELRDAGYCVIEAATGDEAIEILKSGCPIDLVFSDVRMPGAIDGIALLAFVQSNFADTSVILTSGHLSPDIALAKGAAQFLAKPYVVDAAVKMVELEVARSR